ncbi:hypothetical protein FHETE_3714 [Fusarium heterosporum]|uniref:Uncharacterized protein n=1 Tax=Fusarium heterosporum TaxID=42747 RepID=A0A8H5TI14_FUSHE|nr:hypothetical protein FHETE_3714 [Fusarium heterosporum]
MSISTLQRLKRQQSPCDPEPQYNAMVSHGGSCASLAAAENAYFMATSADADDDRMDIDPSPASMQPSDTDTISTAMDLDTVSSSVVNPVLDDVALGAEARVNLYKECIKFDSRNLKPDSQGRFLCPVSATGLVPYFDNDLTRAIGWHQEYLVEVLKSVVFVFATSDSMTLFSAFIHSHFHLEAAQVPQVHTMAPSLHEYPYSQDMALSSCRHVQMAHGQFEQQHKYATSSCAAAC